MPSTHAPLHTKVGKIHLSQKISRVLFDPPTFFSDSLSFYLQSSCRREVAHPPHTCLDALKEKRSSPCTVPQQNHQIEKKEMGNLIEQKGRRKITLSLFYAKQDQHMTF